MSRLYRNLGHLHFKDVTRESGLNFHGWGQGVCVGDYDNDGKEDLFLTYYGHNVLYHNDGGGHFTDVTQEAGLPVDGNRWSTGCSFFDYDRDGFLDIAVANYMASTANPRQRPTIYVNLKACASYAVRGAFPADGIFCTGIWGMERSKTSLRKVTLITLRAITASQRSPATSTETAGLMSSWRAIRPRIFSSATIMMGRLPI